MQRQKKNNETIWGSSQCGLKQEGMGICVKAGKMLVFIIMPAAAQVKKKMDYSFMSNRCLTVSNSLHFLKQGAFVTACKIVICWIFLTAVNVLPVNILEQLCCLLCVADILMVSFWFACYCGQVDRLFCIVPCQHLVLESSETGVSINGHMFEATQFGCFKASCAWNSKKKKISWGGWTCDCVLTTDLWNMHATPNAMHEIPLSSRGESCCDKLLPANMVTHGLCELSLQAERGFSCVFAHSRMHISFISESIFFGVYITQNALSTAGSGKKESVPSFDF